MSLPSLPDFFAVFISYEIVTLKRNLVLPNSPLKIKLVVCCRIFVPHIHSTSTLFFTGHCKIRMFLDNHRCYNFIQGRFFSLHVTFLQNKPTQISQIFNELD